MKEQQCRGIVLSVVKVPMGEVSASIEGTDEDTHTQTYGAGEGREKVGTIFVFLFEERYV